MVATLHLATWACFILISKVASVRVEDQWPDLKLVINSNKFYTKLCVHWVWCSGDLGSGLVVSFFPPWCGHPSIVFGVYSGWCHAAAAFLERWQRDGVFVLSPHRLNQHDALWPTPNIIHGHGIRFSCVCVCEAPNVHLGQPINVHQRCSGNLCRGFFCPWPMHNSRIGQMFWWLLEELIETLWILVYLITYLLFEMFSSQWGVIHWADTFCQTAWAIFDEGIVRMSQSAKLPS